MNMNQRSLHAALFALAACALSGCVGDEPPGAPAAGTYRLPYPDGTKIWVYNDFDSHDPRGRIDIWGIPEGLHRVVAAADGWVRFLEDGSSSRDPGQPHNNFVWIEHPYPYCQPEGVAWPGKPGDHDETCVPCEREFCNEWTKYSHLVKGSASGVAGLAVGDFVRAGQFLGYEGDVGYAAEVHLHWEVAVLDPRAPLKSYEDGWPMDWSGGAWHAAPNLLPAPCGAGVLMEGEFYEAVPCR